MKNIYNNPTLTTMIDIHEQVYFAEFVLLTSNPLNIELRTQNFY